ncbi:MAG: hypothetical protein ACRDU9_04605, partial [Acidimicrobiia bacterium]
TTLVPVRIEVFASESPERELWQLRRGYHDQLGGEDPILIVELSNLVPEPVEIDVDLPEGTPSRGFVDVEVNVPEPALAPGFEPHRSGHWSLGDGGRVEVVSWSDGRSWLMVETTGQWDEPGLFGLSSPFVQTVDLGEGSVGYLAPAGNALAIHADGQEVLVTGSVPRALLVEAAASLNIRGRAVPSHWLEASTVEIDDLPSGTLVPDVDGWSILGRVENDGTTLLLTSGGSRSVLITQEQGSRLDPPTGPDFSAVELRGAEGRYDASTATLEWVEDGQVVRISSETVGMAELLDLAGAMEPR